MSSRRYFILLHATNCIRCEKWLMMFDGNENRRQITAENKKLYSSYILMSGTACHLYKIML